MAHFVVHTYPWLSASGRVVRGDAFIEYCHCLTDFVVPWTFSLGVCVLQFHNTWAQTSGDLSGSTAILSTFQDGILVMAGVGDSGEKRRSVL